MPKWLSRGSSPASSSRSPSPKAKAKSSSPAAPKQSEEAALVAAITDAIRNPLKLAPDVRRKQLGDAYVAAGYAAPAATLEKCMQVITDPNQTANEKIVAIRVLDLLMERHDDALAGLIAKDQIKYFKDLAKRTKEKDMRKKRPPGIFAASASDTEVNIFLIAVCEILDKYGRHYEHDPTLSAFPQARQELLRDRVSLPSPKDYSYVWNDPQAASAGAGVGGDSGGGGGSSPPMGLEEAELQHVADEALDAAMEFGSNDPRAAEARMQFESVLAQWEQAAQSLGEKIDESNFGEFERLSNVLQKFHEIKDELDKADGGEKSRMTSERPEKDKKKKDKSSRKEKGQKSTSTGQDVGWIGAAEAQSSPGGGGGVGGGGCSGDGGFADFGLSHREGWGPCHGNGGEANTTPQFDDFQAQQVMQGMPSLEPELRSLQAQLQQSRAQKQMLADELSAAYRRIRELEPLLAENQDYRRTIATLQEANTQLLAEADHCRREMREARLRAGEATDRLEDREGVISLTRQRLLEEKQRSAQLEDEIRGQADAHRSTQGKLQNARSQQAVTELRLQRTQDILTRELNMPWTENSLLPRSGNIPYGSRDLEVRDHWSYQRSLVKERDLSWRSAPFDSSGREPSVSRSDELADSQPVTPRQESSFESSSRGSSRTPPLQDLAQRNRADMVNTAGAYTPTTGPAISRSSWEVWNCTQVVRAPPGALVARSPPASPACVERTNTNFRNLLASSNGLLYEDERVSMQLVIAPVQTGRNTSIAFEVIMTNTSSQPIQQVQLRATSQQQHACELHFEGERGRAGEEGVVGVLWKQQQLRFRGVLEVVGPFEAGPQAELSYLLADNLCLSARLRLPLAITRLLQAPAPSQLEPRQIVQLWDSAAFAHAEVALVCNVRRDLLMESGPFSIARCLEFGGALRCLPGLDECPRSVVLASIYPQHGANGEVLVRAELGGPLGAGAGSASACRVAVRSASHVVNRALAQAAIDALCDAPVPELPARAA